MASRPLSLTELQNEESSLSSSSIVSPTNVYQSTNSKMVHTLKSTSFASASSSSSRRTTVPLQSLIQSSPNSSSHPSTYGPSPSVKRSNLLSGAEVRTTLLRDEETTTSNDRTTTTTTTTTTNENSSSSFYVRGRRPVTPLPSSSSSSFSSSSTDHTMYGVDPVLYTLVGNANGRSPPGGSYPVRSSTPSNYRSNTPPSGQLSVPTRATYIYTTNTSTLGQPSPSSRNTRSPSIGSRSGMERSSSVSSFVSTGTATVQRSNNNHQLLPKAYTGTLKLTEEEVNAVTTARYTSSNHHYVITTRNKDGIPVLDPYLERLAVPRSHSPPPVVVGNSQRSVSGNRSRTNSVSSVSRSVSRNNGNRNTNKSSPSSAMEDNPTTNGYQSRTSSIGRRSATPTTPERRPWSPAGVSSRSRPGTPSFSGNSSKSNKPTPEILHGPMHVTLHALTRSPYTYASPLEAFTHTYHGPTQQAINAAERVFASPPGLSPVSRLAEWLGVTKQEAIESISSSLVQSRDTSEPVTSFTEVNTVNTSSTTTTTTNNTTIDTQPTVTSSAFPTEQDILRSPAFRNAVVDAALRSLLAASSSSSLAVPPIDNYTDELLNMVQNAPVQDDLVTVTTPNNHILPSYIPLLPPVFTDSHRILPPANLLHPEDEPMLQNPSVRNDILLASTVRKSSERDQIAIPVPRTMPSPSLISVNARRPWHPAGLATEPLPSLDINDGLINNQNPLSISTNLVRHRSHGTMEDMLSEQGVSVLQTAPTSPTSTTTTTSSMRRRSAPSNRLPESSSREETNSASSLPTVPRSHSRGKFVALNANDALHHLVRNKVRRGHHRPPHTEPQTPPGEEEDSPSLTVPVPVRSRIEEAISRAVSSSNASTNTSTQSSHPIISNTDGAEMELDHASNTNIVASNNESNIVELSIPNNESNVIVPSIPSNESNIVEPSIPSNESNIVEPSIPHNELIAEPSIQELLNDLDSQEQAPENTETNVVNLSHSVVPSNTTTELMVVTVLAIFIGYSSSGGFLLLSSILSIILGVIFAYFHQYRQDEYESRKP